MKENRLPLFEGKGAVSPPEGRKKAFLTGIAVIGLLIVVSVGGVFSQMAAKERAMRGYVEKRLDLVVNGRAATISDWMDGLVNQGRRVFASDLFRWYASNVDLLEGADFASLLSGNPGGDEDLDSLTEQLPMMQGLLDDFVRYSGFLDARLVNRKGVTYLATDGALSPLNTRQKQEIRDAFSHVAPHVAPLRRLPAGLVMELYLPVAGLEGTGKKSVAVLLLRVNVKDRIGELVSSTPSGEDGRIRLLQKNGETFEEILPWLPGDLSLSKRTFSPGEGETLSFAERSPMGEDGVVFSTAKRIEGTDWWVLVELEREIALKEIRNLRRVTIGLSVLVALMVATCLGALWWWFVSMESRKGADRILNLARKMEDQKRFLDKITDSLVEHVCLKNPDGSYRFVNASFARAVGRSVENLVGMDDAAVFGYDTAKRMETSDERALRENRPITASERIYLRSEAHDYQITKVPLRFGDGEAPSLLCVMRDITEIVAAQEESARASLQTVEVLVRTIELRDPYLAGHSHLLRSVSGEMARQMGLSENTIATVETGATLSQIGKLFISKEILNKPDALTREERLEVEEHVGYARKVLEEIAFDLPVRDAISQMNEYLDGTGYPDGLEGDAIGMEGRILSVANAFCAMVRPRVYRPAMDLEAVFGVLELAPEKYDQEMVGALRTLMESAQGERLLKNA